MQGFAASPISPLKKGSGTKVPAWYIWNLDIDHLVLLEITPPGIRLGWFQGLVVAAEPEESVTSHEETGKGEEVNWSL